MQHPPNQAFTLQETPDGGAVFHLNLARTCLAVHISPEEVATTKKKIAAYHDELHKKGASVAGDEGVMSRQLRQAVLGLAYSRMRGQVPAHILGRLAYHELIGRAKKKTTVPGKAPIKGAKKPLPKRPAAHPSARPGTRPGVRPTSRPPSAPGPRLPAAGIKFDIVKRGLSLVASRRANYLAYGARRVPKPTPAESAQGQGFAQSLFQRVGIPTTTAPHLFWQKTPQQIGPLVNAAVAKATTEGAPATVPKPFVLDKTKLVAVQKALDAIATRRAKFLAWQRSPKARVIAADIKAGREFARQFALQNGIPSTDAPHAFWNNALQLILTKIGAVARLAETQGAPVKAPVGAKPVVTAVTPKKVSVVKQGLQILASRRARFLAHQRKARVTSPGDIAAGREWARKFFVARNIPTKIPSKKAAVSGLVAGWVSIGAAGAATRAKEIAPAISTAEIARSSIAFGKQTLTNARTLAERKFGGIGKLTGEHAAAMSLVENTQSFGNRIIAQLPASGPISDQHKNMAALFVVQASDALGLFDKLEGTSILAAFKSGIATLLKKIVTAVADAVTAFWSQSEQQIHTRVTIVLKEAEKEAPAKLPPLAATIDVRPPPPRRDLPPRRPPGTGPPGQMPEVSEEEDMAPGNFPAADEGAVPADLPPMPPEYAPGDEPEVPDPSDYEPVPGDMPDGSDEGVPGEGAPEEIPGEVPESEIPGEVDEEYDVAPGDMTEEGIPGEGEEVDEAAEEAVEEVVEEEAIEEEQGETMEGVAGKKISKEKYERMVRKAAAKLASGLGRRFGARKPLNLIPGKHPIASAIWAKAKIKIDAALAKRGVTVAGSHLLGVSDIMGAAYVIGKAKKGNKAAKRAIKKAARAARTGSPHAKRNLRALRIASKLIAA